jgi:putative Holliday junction resolvase
VLGLDLGSRRIGVAVSDPSGTVATPHAVIERSGDDRVDRSTIAALIRSLGVERVVVGLPLSLDGTLGPAARAAQAEVDALSAVVPVPVVTHDERLTTVTAERALTSQKVRARDRRRVVDKVAAAVMLQSWLDSARG